MLSNIVDLYSNFMVSTFGYEMAVRLEDILYGAAMFILGGITMGFFTANFILHLHELKDFGQGKLRLLRYDNGRKAQQFVTVKTLWTSFQVTLLLSFSPILTFKKFTGRDERRTKRFVRIMAVLVVVILFAAAVASCSVLREPIR